MQITSDQLACLKALNDELTLLTEGVADEGATRQALFCTTRVLSQLIATLAVQPQFLERRTGTLASMLPQIRKLLRRQDEAELMASIDRIAHHQVSLDPAQSDGLIATLARELPENDPGASKVVRQLVQVEREYCDGIEAERLATGSAQRVTTQRTPSPSTAELERLRQFLQESCHESGDLRIASVDLVVGGFGKQTLKVALENNRTLPTNVVIRRDLPGTVAGTTVTKEFVLLQTVFAAGVKVPQPWAIDAGAVFDDPMMVMSQVDGRTLGDALDVSKKEGASRYAMDLASELAKIHAIPVEGLPDVGGGADFEQQEIDRCYRTWQSLGRYSLITDAAFDWVLRHRADAAGRLALVHADLRFHNVLTDDRGITAILDWEVARIGNPARDLCYAYHHIAQIADWQQFLDAYVGAGGTLPSPREMRFYKVWVELWLLMYLWQGQAAYLSGAVKSIQLVYTGEYVRQRCLQILADRLTQALDSSP